jgi:hypothetical protein
MNERPRSMREGCQEPPQPAAAVQAPADASFDAGVAPLLEGAAETALETPAANPEAAPQLAAAPPTPNSTAAAATTPTAVPSDPPCFRLDRRLFAAENLCCCDPKHSRSGRCFDEPVLYARGLRMRMGFERTHREVDGCSLHRVTRCCSRADSTRTAS